MLYSRRDFILRLTLAGTAGSIVACSDSRQTTTELDLDSAPFTCVDTEGLTESETRARAALEYVDSTPIQGKTCSNCALYVVPGSGAQCGSCLTVKGPVHPEGYCTIWAELKA